MIILILLYYIIIDASLQCNHLTYLILKLQELWDTYLTLHKGSNWIEKQGKSIFQLMFFLPGDIFVS